MIVVIRINKYIFHIVACIGIYKKAIKVRCLNALFIINIWGIFLFPLKCMLVYPPPPRI